MAHADDAPSVALAPDQATGYRLQATGPETPAYPYAPYPYAYPYYPYAPYPYYYPYPPQPVEQLLTLQAASGARLEVLENNDWRSVCRAPCTTRAFVGAQYRVTGEHIVTSRTFALSPSPYPALLRADVGSTSARTLGTVLIVLGAVAIGGGAVVAMSNGDNSTDDRAGLIGGFAAAVGGGVLTAGIIIVTANKTRLDFVPAP